MEVRKERVCAQLVEQHTVAQDWLREQVKAFGALPTERRGLQNSINTLKVCFVSLFYSYPFEPYLECKQIGKTNVLHL